MSTIFEQLVILNQTTKAILDILGGAVTATGFQLSQIQKGVLMPITGVPVSGSGTFQETPDPSGSSIVGVPSFASDHPEVVLSASPDADPTKVVATASSSAVAGNTFNLTVSGTNTRGEAISTVFNIPIIPAAAPVATGFTLNQLS